MHIGLRNVVVEELEDRKHETNIARFFGQHIELDVETIWNQEKRTDQRRYRENRETDQKNVDQWRSGDQSGNDYLIVTEIVGELVESYLLTKWLGSYKYQQYKQILEQWFGLVVWQIGVRFEEKQFKKVGIIVYVEHYSIEERRSQ